MQKENEIELCSCEFIHEEQVEKVKNTMLTEETIISLSEFFKVLGDPTRIKILYAISISEMCVCDIANLLQMQQSAVSHQLRILRNSRLVKYRRQGKVVYYSLDDDHVEQLFRQGLEHIIDG